MMERKIIIDKRKINLEQHFHNSQQLAEYIDGILREYNAIMEEGFFFEIDVDHDGYDYYYSNNKIGFQRFETDKEYNDRVKKIQKEKEEKKKEKEEKKKKERIEYERLKKKFEKKS